MAQDFIRLLSGVQLKTYELFISEIFQLIFSEPSWLQETETMESKIEDKKKLLSTQSQDNDYYAIEDGGCLGAKAVVFGIGDVEEILGWLAKFCFFTS